MNWIEDGLTIVAFLAMIAIIAGGIIVVCHPEKMAKTIVIDGHQYISYQDHLIHSASCTNH